MFAPPGPKEAHEESRRNPRNLKVGILKGAPQGSQEHLNGNSKEPRRNLRNLEDEGSRGHRQSLLRQQ